MDDWSFEFVLIFDMSWKVLLFRLYIGLRANVFMNMFLLIIRNLLKHVVGLVWAGSAIFENILESLATPKLLFRPNKTADSFLP